MKSYTQKQIDEAQKLYETTCLTNQQIGDELDIPKGTIQMWTKKYNWNRPEELKQIHKMNKNNNRPNSIVLDDDYYKAKDLYENTCLSIPDIVKRTNLTLDQIHSRINKYKWQRSEEQIRQMFSNKNKQRYQNFTEERKQEIRQKMSDTNKKVWAERSVDKKKQIVKHRMHTISNKSKEDLDKTNLKISQGVKNTWNSKSEQEKEQIKSNQIAVWNSKSEQEKEQFSQKMKQIWNDSSDEYKESFIQHHKDTWNNKSEQEMCEFKNKISNTFQNMPEERKQQIKDKIKHTWLCMSEERRKDIANKISKAHKSRTDYEITESVRQRRETMHKNNSFKNANSIDGKRFDSKYEVLVYEYCKKNNIPVECQIPIEYEYNGEQHITFIDFRIDGILFEVKGGHLLHGIYDYAMPIPIEEKLKIYKEHDVIVITDKYGSQIIPKKESKDSNGLKYKNKCPYPLIGIDIDLFDNPQFPFAKDKPECFYKVSVDGKLSALDAWNDELIRWNMIKNRINYVGGFIDSKAILTAMNVTRTCKQPSWFSKSYAKQLIEKYITTNTIIDPFSGWGARCDASLELNKNYIGGDLNPELVEWHKSLNRPITLLDANNFKYDKGDCSVFICPPYTDYEKYFDGQDLKTTQCEWLDIIMKNVPNAKEYLMVCKVVDPGWEKYIVEEKINKSHLGTNKEYVLLIRH